MIGLHFKMNNSVVIDTTHGLKRLPHLTMQYKMASIETNAKLQLVSTDDVLRIPPRTTETIRVFVERPSEWNTTGTVTPLDKFTETAILLIFHSNSAKIGKRRAVRVTIIRESPYVTKKNIQIAEFSVVTPEQPKHLEPVVMAMLSMIPQGDPDLTVYLNELLRMNKPEQKHNTLRFPTPEIPGNSEDYTSIWKRILKELCELKEKEKFNTQESTESGENSPEWFDWTNTLLMERGK